MKVGAKLMIFFETTNKIATFFKIGMKKVNKVYPVSYIEL